ncbi:tigger transposable element-derived protein 4-like [Argopecten irradians]|uniref:tigger transposable element-derived protein 4-like n=1 Tax=Argopecten irradians TaxID=31199 RepID=UPI00371D8B5B
MDQGVIHNLKVHYRKLVIQRKIRAVDNKSGEVSITVLDAIRMLNQAWGSVKDTTIRNCFRHAGFVSATTISDDDEAPESDDDPEDDVPLGTLFGLPTGVKIGDYVAVDSVVPTSAEATDDYIINSIVCDREPTSDDDDNDDNDDTCVPKPKPTLESALSACDVLREFLECTETSETVLSSLAKSEHFQREYSSFEGTQPPDQHHKLFYEI